MSFFDRKSTDHFATLISMKYHWNSRFLFHIRQWHSKMMEASFLLLLAQHIRLNLVGMVVEVMMMKNLSFLNLNIFLSTFEFVSFLCYHSFGWWFLRRDIFRLLFRQGWQQRYYFSFRYWLYTLNLRLEVLWSR